jgi:hypothetical protein
MRGALPNPEAAILLMGYVAMNHKACERKVPKLGYERSFQWEKYSRYDTDAVAICKNFTTATPSFRSCKFKKKL